MKRLELVTVASLTTLAASPAIGDVVRDNGAPHAVGNLLWDNGRPNGVNAYSNGTGGVE